MAQHQVKNHEVMKENKEDSRGQVDTLTRGKERNIPGNNRKKGEKVPKITKASFPYM